MNYIGIKVSSQYLILAVSNLMRINPNILNKGSTCQKAFCPTPTHLLTCLDHANSCLDHVTVEKQPERVLLHCGINGLDKLDFLVENFENNFVEVITKLRKKFPSSKLIIASILPRRENRQFKALFKI